ncbi:LysR family transcriptional regulator [Diaphorobacter ruginosibacter]|uniref:LysR family transcriptional regulator n=1 Tax=Diaphorobacter ruginosibacter TaxID=1715720 RepID=UPI00334137F3
MRNINLDQLQTLIAIADLGTFAAAAQALHLAPPTVSLHIKELESRMQAVLVLRGRRQAELTAAGEALVHEGRKLLSASDDLIELVRRRASGREGLVRVGVSAGVSTRLLPMMLEMLARRNPGVEVRLEAVGSADAMRRLRAATLDVAIVASPQPVAAEVEMIPWRNDPMMAVVPTSWNAPARITPEWLADRRWASFAPATQMHGLISTWFGQAGFNPRPYLALSYPGALKSLAAASQSAAILPFEEVEELEHSQDVAIRPLHPALMRPMAIAFRRAPVPQAAIACVVGVLCEFANTG